MGGLRSTRPVVVPGPSVAAPAAVYGPNGGYYDAPLSAYAAARLPVTVPYYDGRGRCIDRYGVGRYGQACY
jgi:hypothetical protein